MYLCICTNTLTYSRVYMHKYTYIFQGELFGLEPAHSGKRGS